MNRTELKEFFANFEYGDHRFEIEFTEDFYKPVAVITKSAQVRCVVTKEMKIFSDTRRIPYTDLNEFDLLNYMRNWLINLIIHENDELITYRGKRVFNPHKTWSHIMEPNK